ncbi:hypothetical protein I6M56_13235 [Shewanella algae]|uniref:hypothetical protein n=1 Tax=Shewanella algae TaxID=38313 RepID=UPI001AAFFEAC|nr:hypothetical protein [Shewanella algae]MBO2679812.1 hypothetical protein [Shewanella algae]
MFYHKPSSAEACRRAVGHSTDYAQKGITHSDKVQAMRRVHNSLKKENSLYGNS